MPCFAVKSHKEAKLFKRPNTQLSEQAIKPQKRQNARKIFKVLFLPVLRLYCVFLNRGKICRLTEFEAFTRQNNQGTMVFSAKQREYLGFIALQSEYAGILRLGTAPLKDVVCRKSSTGNKKIFSF